MEIEISEDSGEVSLVPAYPALLASVPAIITPVAPPVRVRRPARILIVGLTLGALSDALLYGQRIGVGFTLFALAALAALIAVGFWERETGEPAVAIRWGSVVSLAIGVVFFAAMAAVRADALLTVMNVALCLRLGGLLVRCLRSRDLAELSLIECLFGPWQTGGRALTNAGPVIAAVRADMPDRGRVTSVAATAVRGVGWSVVPLVVFVALLSSADARFGHFVNTVGAWLLPIDLPARICRLSLSLAVAFVATGALATAVVTRAKAATLPALASDIPDAPRGIIGFAEVMIVLVSVCVVFGAFLASQMTSFVAASGLACANQARSGFYELVWVAVLALTLISALRSAARIESTGRAQNAFRTASTLLIGLTLVVLISAVQRMSAFEDAYGATPKRIAVDTFITFLSLALLWRVATLFVFTRRPTFAAGLMLCAFAYAAAIDCQVPEAATIRVNMARYQASHRLDETQLTQPPTDDAVPALCDAFRATAPETPLHKHLKETLRTKQAEMQSDAKFDAWPAFNLSRWTARRALFQIDLAP